jgi:hypothetical protein
MSYSSKVIRSTAQALVSGIRERYAEHAGTGGERQKIIIRSFDVICHGFLELPWGRECCR